MNPAKPLPNERHEAFAVHYAAGGNASAAWRHATGGQQRYANANANGCKWANISSIRLRVEWLRGAAAQKLQAGWDESNGAAVLEIAEKRRFLARVVRATIAETPDSSDLWQDVEVMPGRLKRKLPDKLRAIALDNDLAGVGSEAAAASAVPEIAAALFDRLFSVT